MVWKGDSIEEVICKRTCDQSRGAGLNGTETVDVGEIGTAIICRRKERVESAVDIDHKGNVFLDRLVNEVGGSRQR